MHSHAESVSQSLGHAPPLVRPFDDQHLHMRAKNESPYRQAAGQRDVALATTPPFVSVGNLRYELALLELEEAFALFKVLYPDAI